jgi:hypothetical protein
VEISSRLKKTNEQFLGYALFVADPEFTPNPGYYEYFEHYTPATGFVACAGDDCPLCAEGDNPNTRAKSMWLVVENEDDDPETGAVKIFNLNWGLVQEFYEDGADLLGRLYRIKKLEGKKGTFSIRPKTAKLNKTELKAAMKGIEEGNLENIVQRQMNRVFEEMDVAAAMENDDDDDDTNEKETAAPKSRKGTAKADPEPDEPEAEAASSGFDPDEDAAFEGNVTIVKINKRLNIATVQDEAETEFALYGTDDIDVTTATKGEVFTASAGKDEDGDFVLDMWEPLEVNGDEPAGEAFEGDEVTDEIVTVVKVNPSPTDTLVVELEGGEEFELFFMGNGEDENGKEWADLDIDDYSVGDKITISAKKDDDGDMIATVFPEAAKGKSKAKAKTTGRK